MSDSVLNLLFPSSIELRVLKTVQSTTINVSTSTGTSESSSLYADLLWKDIKIDRDWVGAGGRGREGREGGEGRGRRGKGGRGRKR